VAKFAESFGNRVQKSVFEFYTDDFTLNNIEKKIKMMIEDEDSYAFIPACIQDWEKTVRYVKIKKYYIDPKEEEGGLNLYAFVNNNPLNIFDKLGLEFLYYDGSKITAYSGSGYVDNKSPFDCGKASQSWRAYSGGTNDKPGIPEGWYKTKGLLPLADKISALDIGVRSEKSFWENGIYYQGTMAAWDKEGYGYYKGPYGESYFYGYNPNDQNDQKIGMPNNVEYKVGLAGTHGNSVSYNRGFRIHPMDRTTTSGCIGIRGYSISVSFLNYIENHEGIELYVGESLPCCKKGDKNESPE
jgi:CRISPR/Cas system-associated endoribonuclease Cas2